MLIEKQPATGRPGASTNFKTATPIFLVGDIETVMPWYQALGFEAVYFPPGFCILRRDAIQIFLQHQEGYTRPDEPLRREREAWDLYIETDNVQGLFEDFLQMSGVKIIRGLCEQEYGQTDFEVVDPNGYVLVFSQPD
jgi:Glyoxalase-like domain